MSLLDDNLGYKITKFKLRSVKDHSGRYISAGACETTQLTASRRLRSLSMEQAEIKVCLRLD